MAAFGGFRSVEFSSSINSPRYEKELLDSAYIRRIKNRRRMEVKKSVEI